MQRNFSYVFHLEYPLDTATEAIVTAQLRHLEATFNSLIRDRLAIEHQLRATHSRPLAEHIPPALPVPGLGAVIRSPATPTFRCMETFDMHSGPVHSIDVSPDNQRIATASWDATVNIYNLRSRQKETTLSSFQKGPMEDSKGNLWDAGDMGGLYCVKFARSASHPSILGCASADHMVYLWNFEQPQQGVTMRLKGHEDEVNCIDFHPQQSVVCSTSDDGDAIVWDFSGVTLRTLPKHPRAVYGAAFLGQEQEYLVATVCFDQKTRVYDMRDKQIVAQLQGHTDDVIGIDYSSKSLLATGSDDGVIVLWDARTWNCVTKYNTRHVSPENEVKRVKFSRDGKLEIAAGGSNNSITLFDVDTEKANAGPTHTLAGHQDCVFDVAWGVAQNGNPFLVSASHDHTWKYWHLG